MIEGQEGVTWDDWVRLARPHRGARARRALPLRPLHGDHPAAGRRARRLGDARRPRGGHGADPARHARLARHVPASERARAHGRHRRPHLGRPRRRRHGLGLVRARAPRARLPVPRREGSGSSSSPSRSRSSCAPGRRSASTTPGLPTSCAARRRSRGPLQRPHPPLVLGGTVKPRFAALAARYANEVNTLGAPNDELRERKERSTARAPRSVVTRRRSALRDDGLLPRGRPRRGRSSASAASSTSAATARARPTLLDERRDRWLAGTVDEVAARIEELRAIGVTRVFLQHLNHDDDDDGRARRRAAAAAARVSVAGEAASPLRRR